MFHVFECIENDWIHPGHTNGEIQNLINFRKVFIKKNEIFTLSKNFGCIGTNVTLWGSGGKYF